MYEFTLVLSEDDVPTLKVPTGYLSFFRGYRAQVSGTVDGAGDNGSSETTLKSDMEYFRKHFSEQLNMLPFIAHCLQAYDLSVCGVPEDKYTPLLSAENRTVFEEFVVATSDKFYDGCTAPLEFLQSIHISDVRREPYYAALEQYTLDVDLYSDHSELITLLANGDTVCSSVLYKNKAHDIVSIYISTRDYAKLVCLDTGRVYTFPIKSYANDDTWDNAQVDSVLVYLLTGYSNHVYNTEVSVCLLGVLPYPLYANGCSVVHGVFRRYVDGVLVGPVDKDATHILSFAISIGDIDRAKLELGDTLSSTNVYRALRDHRNTILSRKIHDAILDVVLTTPSRDSDLVDNLAMLLSMAGEFVKRSTLSSLPPEFFARVKECKTVSSVYELLGEFN